MCGICGIVAIRGRKVPDRDLEAMSRVLHHRGPDDQGSLISGNVALGFRRLSIIDLPGGRQPMSNEEGNVWIVFNGEIYNHLELRTTLEQRGHRYATKSDTETILHLYEEYGEDCVNHLRGIFAFGYLSSEETLFEDVRKLLPGHCLRIDLKAQDKNPEVKTYWDLDTSPSESSLGESDYVAQFRDLFTGTVRAHLMSDVPVGVFLSGGLDSSSIAAVMADLRKEPIQTFSVGYAEDEYSELSYARQVAKHIGAEYNEVILGPEEFFASLPQLIWHEDEPLVWPSSVALHYVSRLAREKVKVVLTGEGGDEIFAGYLKYRVTLWNLRAGPLYRKLVPQALQPLTQKTMSAELIPDWARRKLRHSFLYYPDSFEKIYFDNFYSVFPQDQQSALFTSELTGELCDINAYVNSMRFFPSNGSNGNLLNRLLYLDTKTYLVELLMKQDQMSMATSIESRVPFLDHKFVEFAARIPARYK